MSDAIDLIDAGYDNAELHQANTELMWIIQDLVTELNAVIDTRQSSHDLFRSLRKSADKAEARLREVGDE